MKIKEARSKKHADVETMRSNPSDSVANGKTLKNSAHKTDVKQSKSLPISSRDIKAGKLDKANRDERIGNIFTVS